MDINNRIQKVYIKAMPSVKKDASKTDPGQIKPKRTKAEVTAETKGGKKTRGSKIITKQQIVSSVTAPALTNVILNLKCSMSDLKEYNTKLSQMISNPLEYNSSAPPEVKYYDGEKKFGAFIRQDSNIAIVKSADKEEEAFANFPASESGVDFKQNEQTYEPIYDRNVKITKQNLEDITTQDDNDDVNVKDMSSKIKQLKIQLYKNTLNTEKKSACFWCTYDFDNSPCYIPKYEMDGTIYGYGSFCRPECAVAYLMKETIDDSTKFDRYHLLNQIYSKVYECKKNIKPAPDPHYLLDKFYGNLTIQEYRRLLKTEHLLLVIDKPLTRILPELHEDTDDAFTKIYGIKAQSGNTSGVYKVKRQSEQPQGPSKASIVKNTFGIMN